MDYRDEAKRRGVVLYVLAVLLLAAAVAAPLLVHEGRSTAQVVLLAVALVGSAYLAQSAGALERSVRGEGMALFAIPGVIIFAVFHGLYWTERDPSTTRAVTEGVLAVLLALSGPALRLLGGLGAGLAG
ncbi:MAG: hypothetical protein ACAI25_16010 [Planctomycetota bacterium]